MNPTKTSHKKNRPFDFKLIDLVKPHPELYLRQAGLNTYEAMKVKNHIWKQIAEQMGSPVDFCISRWSNLRGQFQKELRHCRELCPKRGIIRGSHWPYLEPMRFLEVTVQFNRAKREKIRKRKPKVKKLEQSETTDSDSQMEWEDDEEGGEEEEEEEAEAEEAQAEDRTIEIEQPSPVENVEDEVLDEIMENEHYSILEEIAEEEAAAKRVAEKLGATSSNLQRMTTLMVGIEGEQMARMERRIMAFLCKCQLRALSNEGVDDLYV